MEVEGDARPVPKQNDAPSNNIQSGLERWRDRRMCHTNRRSISDQDECNLPAGRCQAATYPARKKQADLSCIHLKISDVFLWCICLYLTIVATVRRTTEMGPIKRHRSNLPSKPTALHRDDGSAKRSAQVKAFASQSLWG